MAPLLLQPSQTLVAVQATPSTVGLRMHLHLHLQPQLHARELWRTLGVSAPHLKVRNPGLRKKGARRVCINTQIFKASFLPQTVDLSTVQMLTVIQVCHLAQPPKNALRGPTHSELGFVEGVEGVGGNRHLPRGSQSQPAVLAPPTRSSAIRQDQLRLKTGPPNPSPTKSSLSSPCKTSQGHGLTTLLLRFLASWDARCRSLRRESIRRLGLPCCLLAIWR